MRGALRRFVIGTAWAIAALVLIAGACLYVVVAYSETTRELVCNGHWNGTTFEPETAYVQLKEYRPWVKLWSNRQGRVLVQTDKRTMSGAIRLP